MTNLFQSAVLGEINLKNRIVMAPMTRSRADPDGVINSSAARYYAQRASAGLIVTEGVNVGPLSKAFDRTPGLWTDDQVQGWFPIVQAVHREGGLMVAQLWHGGRASASGLLDGHEPISPSGVNDDLGQLQVWGQLANGAYVKIAATPSRAMTAAEIEEVVHQYRTAANNALRAGFDGVEIHAANGYLIQEFLSPTINRRSDRYGGDAAGRARFLHEVFEAIAEVVPRSRIGIRLSPFARYNNVRDPDPADTYGYVANWLSGAGLAYLHLADTNAWAGAPDYRAMMDLFSVVGPGSLIVNGGMTPPRATEILASGEAAAVAFGRLFLSNPDLPARIEKGGPFNPGRPVGIYGGGDAGYLDYPALATGQSEAAAA
jgi:N-ethylmaleimide reductase